MNIRLSVSELPHESSVQELTSATGARVSTRDEVHTLDVNGPQY